MKMESFYMICEKEVELFGVKFGNSLPCVTRKDKWWQAIMMES
jgi:hypothetical protein